MHADGLLSVTSDKTDGRPAKFVYSVTEKGADAFAAMLRELLDFNYRPTFSSDAVFFFSEHLDDSEIAEPLTGYIEKLRKKLAYLEEHRAETLESVPDSSKKMADIIFSHHERHYRAELDWAEETAAAINS